MHNHNLTRGLWGIIALLALCVCANGSRAKSKPSAWDTRALAAKADYIFLEAERHRVAQEFDAYYYLIDRATADKPDDSYMLYMSNMMKLIAHNRDSVEVARAYAAMRRYIDENPADEHNSEIYAGVSRRVGRDDVARLIYKRLHSIYPDNQELTFKYVQSMFLSPDTAERSLGMALLDSIEAAEGKSPQITNSKIGRYAEMNDTASIRREIDALVEAFPANSGVLAYAGEVMMSLDDRDRALQLYNLACAADSTNGYAYYARANYYNNIGDTLTYNREIAEALRRPSLDMETKIQLLQSYIETSALDVGILDEGTDSAGITTPADAADEMPIDGEEVECVDTVASTVAEMARLAKIDELFNVLLDDYSLEPEVYNFYASYLLSIPDYEGAAEQLSRSLDIDPSNEDRWLLLLNLDARVREAQDVLTDAERARRYFPENPSIPTLAALALLQEEDYDEAINQIDLALQLTDSTDYETRSSLYGTRGDALYAIGQTDKALADYRLAIQINPDNSMALNNLAYNMVLSGGNAEEALEMIKRACALRPDDPTLLDTYAWVLFKLKRYPEALDKIKAAIEMLAKTEPVEEIYDHAGDIYFMNGDRDNALKMWKKAQELNPNNQLVRKKVRNKTIFFE